MSDEEIRRALFIIAENAAAAMDATHELMRADSWSAHDEHRDRLVALIDTSLDGARRRLLALRLPGHVEDV